MRRPPANYDLFDARLVRQEVFQPLGALSSDRGSAPLENERLQAPASGGIGFKLALAFPLAGPVPLQVAKEDVAGRPAIAGEHEGIVGSNAANRLAVCIIERPIGALPFLRGADIHLRLGARRIYAPLRGGIPVLSKADRKQSK